MNTVGGKRYGKVYRRRKPTLNRGVGEDLSEEVTFEQRSE